MQSSPSVSDRLRTMTASFTDSVWRLKARFSTASSSPSGNTLRGTPGRFLSWFRDLPSIPKIIIVGLLAIILLVLLSPVMRVAATATLIVSVGVLIVRGFQRKSIREWGIIAVASLILIPVFGGISAIFYDSGTLLGGVASSERSLVSLFARSGDWDSEEDYVADMKDSLQRIGNIEGNVADEISAYDFFDDYTLEEDVATEIAVARADLESHIDYFEDTTPPTGYGQYQEEMLASWEALDASLEILYEDFYYDEPASYDEGMDAVQDFYDTAGAAEEELPNTEEAQELKGLGIGPASDWRNFYSAL